MLLQKVEQGDRESAAELLPLVYQELRKLAAAKMANLGPDQTLQPTALVHDAYLKLVGEEDPGWEGRRHFFGAAANAMRQILIDAARRKKTAKHGGGHLRADLDPDQTPAMRFSMPVEDMVAFDEALHALERQDAEKAEMVKLRIVLGLSREQTSEVLGISTRTLDRHWRFIVAHMHRSIHPQDERKEVE